jgi:hypothetical protein
MHRYGDALWAMQWKYSDMEASTTRSLPPIAAPSLDAGDEVLRRRRTTIAGPADALVEALHGIQRKAGVPVEFVARSHLPMLEYEVQLELMSELAEGIAPFV